jgi:hypothetical protein
VLVAVDVGGGLGVSDAFVVGFGKGVSVGDSRSVLQLRIVIAKSPVTKSNEENLFLFLDRCGFLPM